MATRNDIQVALDLVRFINIANDLIDTASYSLKEIDNLTGLDLLYTEQSGAKRSYTFGELVDKARKELQAVLTYEAMITDFIANYGVQGVADALNALSVDPVIAKNELAAMGDEAKYILTQINATKVKADLLPLSTHIDQAVPKLALVRRAWSLEK